MGEIGLFEAMYSQAQVSRYKPDPVPREALDKVIDAATKAPNGANTQPWEFVVVTDRDLIARIGALYQENAFRHLGVTPPPDESPAVARAHRQARYLAAHITDVPAMILACVDHTRGSGYVPGQPIVRGRYASSILLAVQNLFLAARGLGLGTRFTTAHLRHEQEIKDLLGIPELVETVCLIPIGYPQGNFSPAVRRPSSEVTSYNRFGNRG